MPCLELIQNLHGFFEVLIGQQVVALPWIIVDVMELVPDFVDQVLELVDAECLLEHTHLLQVIGVRWRSTKDLLVILVVADMENSSHEVVNPAIQQKGVRNIPLIRNGQPQLQIFLFLLEGLGIDFDSSLKANGINFFL
jgi:hypothetical protein